MISGNEVLKKTLVYDICVQTQYACGYIMINE